MVLLLPIVFPLVGMALLVWALAPVVFHPLLMVIAITVIVLIVANFVRGVIRKERAVQGLSRPLNNYRWLPQWDAAQFLHHFDLFMRARGWRIIESGPTGQERVLVVADKTKSKCRIALLGLRPGQTVSGADFNELDAMRKAQRATRAAVVMEPKPSQEEQHAAMDHGLLILRFADLDSLEDALNVVEDR